MIIATCLLLRFAAGAAFAAVELPARSLSRAVQAPAVSLWAPAPPARGSTLLSAPVLAMPALPPSPVPFSAAPLDLSRAAQNITAAYNNSRRTIVTPPPKKEQAAFAYTDFGKPGKVDETKAAKDLDLRFCACEW